jgi:hypothetical protein
VLWITTDSAQDIEIVAQATLKSLDSLKTLGNTCPIDVSGTKSIIWPILHTLATASSSTLNALVIEAPSWLWGEKYEVSPAQFVPMHFDPKVK